MRPYFQIMSFQIRKKIWYGKSESSISKFFQWVNSFGCFQGHFRHPGWVTFDAFWPIVLQGTVLKKVLQSSGIIQPRGSQLRSFDSPYRSTFITRSNHGKGVKPWEDPLLSGEKTKPPKQLLEKSWHFQLANGRHCRSIRPTWSSEEKGDCVGFWVPFFESFSVIYCLLVWTFKLFCKHPENEKLQTFGKSILSCGFLRDSNLNVVWKTVGLNLRSLLLNGISIAKKHPARWAK